MYVPGISKHLYPRKGGGGGGKGGKTGGGGGGGKSGDSGSRGISEPLSGSTGGRSGSTITSYGNGGGKPFTISSNQPFAGRSAGGGTRNQVFGSRIYGSGYPGVSNSRGIAGLGFPFLFWPVVWGASLGYGASYLHDTHEYGDPTNSSRPGGPMTQTTFTDSNSNNTFHLLADNSTVLALIGSVSSNCSLGNSTVLNPIPVNGSDPLAPRPEQAVQYYRASSVVLTLDGYNNTAALSNDSSLPDTPLPSWVDQPFLDCLNQTIGAAVPLVDGALPFGLHVNLPGAGLLGLIWILVFCHLTF